LALDKIRTEHVY